MLIKPNNVTDYTAFPAVKARPPELLEYDILQAQAEVFQITGHRFDDPAKYPVDPQTGDITLTPEVRLAFVKMAEYFALTNGDEALAKGYKSEKIGDYSYQLGDGKVQSFSLTALLAGHINGAEPTPTNAPRFRMRAI